jgi:lysophospholipase L1-like esterase
MKAIPPIHIWGDSISKGVTFDETRQRYVISRERSTDRVQAEWGVSVENHARMGATVVDGLAGLDKIAPEPGTIIAIEYGGNDCDLPWAEVARDPSLPHQARVPLEQFRTLLAQFVERVRSAGALPLLITPPPLDAERYFNWVTRGLDAAAVLRFLGDVQHIYRWQERYALAVRDVAQQTGTALLDLRDAFLAQADVAGFLCIDGIHPNGRGQQLIADAILAEDRRFFKVRLAY